MQPATLVASIARARETERHERHAVGAAERTGDNGKGDRDVRNGVGRDLLADDLHTATISCDDVGHDLSISTAEWMKAVVSLPS
jgi:hypothetical protein